MEGCGGPQRKMLGLNGAGFEVQMEGFGGSGGYMQRKTAWRPVPAIFSLCVCEVGDWGLRFGVSSLRLKVQGFGFGVEG